MMPARSLLRSFWLVAGVVGPALLACVASGCDTPDLIREPTAETCSPPAAHAERTRPPHTISIDGRVDFSPAERFASSTGSQRFATWDACRLYFGYRGPGVGASRCEDAPPGRAADTATPACPPAHRGGSPYTYLRLYLDVDPLGDAGSRQTQRPADASLRLPFRADYLVEIRTGATQPPPPTDATGSADARDTTTTDSEGYAGNAQLYRRAEEWNTGFARSWEAMGRDALDVATNADARVLEVSVDRSALGSPCAVAVTSWVTDARDNARFAAWPPASPGASTADSLAEYGFPLVDGLAPRADVNVNRTDYSAVGACARGAGLTM